MSDIIVSIILVLIPSRFETSQSNSKVTLSLTFSDIEAYAGDYSKRNDHLNCQDNPYKGYQYSYLDKSFFS